MKGGGVKGLAFGGALVELAPHMQFGAFAGTSAGAIAAVLLAAGYSAQELLSILRDLDFRRFVDSRWRWPWNLATKGGLNSGKPLEDWLNYLLSEKLPRQQLILMRELPTRAVVFASTWGQATVVFDGGGDNGAASAAFAARCSSSIPFFFVPREQGGAYLYDGGLLNNFPVDECTKLLGHDFVGLYLTAGSRPRVPRTNIGRILDILIERDYRELVDTYIDRVVVVDPTPVRTTAFSLSEEEKDLLEWSGRFGARTFLHDKGLTTAAQVAEARDRLDCARTAVGELHAKRRRRRLGLGITALVLALAVLLLWQSTAADSIKSEVVKRVSRLPLVGRLMRQTEIVPPPPDELIRHVGVLSPIDYSAVAFTTIRTYVDFRDWRSVPAGRQAERVSPVTWTRLHRLKKVAVTGEVRFRVSTEGTAIDARCSSGQPYRIEFAPSPGSPATVLMTAYDVVVDIAKYPLHQEFEVRVDATLWNGSSNLQEDWWAYQVRAPLEAFEVILEFPVTKHPRNQPTPVLYKPTDAVEYPVPPGDTLLFPANTRVYWKVPTPLLHHTYELQWKW